MEMAHYDIPALIYYILAITEVSNVTYVGHSMGTTGLFAAISLNPDLNDKVQLIIYLCRGSGQFRLCILL